MSWFSIKAKYDAVAQSASTTVSTYVGDLKINATCADSTFKDGPSLSGVALGVEKPGFFIFDYDLPKKAPRFQFMSSASIVGKKAKFTYIHMPKSNMTLVDGSLALDWANKVSAKYNFASSGPQVKYSFVHRGITTWEPAYDFGGNSWSFAASHLVTWNDTVKASFESQRNTIGLDWIRESENSGAFKVSASMNIDPEKSSPKLIAEKTWTFDF